MKKVCIILLIILSSAGGALAEADPVSVDINVSGTVNDTIVTIMGYAQPTAFITYYRDGNVAGTNSANSNGWFKKSLLSENPGTHTYGVSAEDYKGRTTPTYSFVLDVQSHNEHVISNIILPPTIETLKGEYEQGEPIDIFGQTVPDAQVDLFVNSVSSLSFNIDADSQGKWSHTINENLSLGKHESYSNAKKGGGYSSSNSETVEFYVTERTTYCNQADINQDGRVDLYDLSILLYHWGSDEPKADLSCNGFVDLTDFSIMLYYWTG